MNVELPSASVCIPHCTPHENTMARNPLRVRENEEEEGTVYTDQGSEMPPSSEGVYVHRPECAMLPESWSYPFMHDMTSNMMYAQSSAFSNQVHQIVYHPPVIHPPPMLYPNLGLPYFSFAQQSCPFQEINSRGSFSSYSSCDTLGSSARRRRNRGRNQQRSDKRHGGTGTPPNRGWNPYDDSTTFYHEQIVGRIVEIAKDREGSKYIQRRLQIADTHEIQIVFNEALDNVEQLGNDVYGNYILQILLELGTNDMRDRLGRKIIESGVFALSTKIYGCRLIQKALDTLGIEDIASLVGSLKGKILHLVHDHNGNHVIQRAVTKINEFCHRSQNDEECAAHLLLLDSLDVIISEVTTSIHDIAVHPYGCRIVQRLIENCTGDHKIQVLDSILANDLTSNLINNEYGNYVVQRMLKFGRTSDRVTIFGAIHTNVLSFSKQKHASNVVEMMLTYGNTEQRHELIEEMLDGYYVDQKNFKWSAAVFMAKHGYANYVIKTALEIVEEGPQRERLFGMLLSDLGVLEMSPFAKRVVLRVKAYTRESNEA